MQSTVSREAPDAAPQPTAGALFAATPPRLTKGQRDFLRAVFEGRNCTFHRRVVQPMFDACYVPPRPGNIFFFIAGCNGHNPAEFALLQLGFDALVGQTRIEVAS